MANLDQTLTTQEADKFAGLLEDYFPWLGTDTEAVGSDTVDNVCELYHDLQRRLPSKA